MELRKEEESDDESEEEEQIPMNKQILKDQEKKKNTQSVQYVIDAPELDEPIEYQQKEQIDGNNIKKEFQQEEGNDIKHDFIVQQQPVHNVSLKSEVEMRNLQRQQIQQPQVQYPVPLSQHSTLHQRVVQQPIFQRPSMVQQNFLQSVQFDVQNQFDNSDMLVGSTPANPFLQQRKKRGFFKKLLYGNDQF